MQGAGWQLDLLWWSLYTNIKLLCCTPETNISIMTQKLKRTLKSYRFIKMKQGYLGHRGTQGKGDYVYKESPLSQNSCPPKPSQVNTSILALYQAPEPPSPQRGNSPSKDSSFPFALQNIPSAQSSHYPYPPSSLRLISPSLGPTKPLGTHPTLETLSGCHTF